MSLIGKLEQLDLSSVLKRLETYTKTGALVVKQGAQWVEFYFREGRLICIGPVRTDATLCERLLQAGVISEQAVRETMLVMGGAQPGEMRMALTLMDLGHVEHDALRAWATQNALGVLQAVCMWSHGEIYFEDDANPPPDRLLVALSITTLLSYLSTTTVNPLSYSTVSNVARPQTQNLAPVSTVLDSPTLFDASQFFSDSPAVHSTEALSPVTGGLLADIQPPVSVSPGPIMRQQPMPTVMPIAPRRIDVSFMQPEMVLVPMDLSPVREHNVQIQVTPEQWRLLTLVDGQTTLVAACQELGMMPEMICQLAGELIVAGLVNVVLPSQLQSMAQPMSEFMPASTTGPIPPSWSGEMSSPEMLPQYSPILPSETRSQWGNGGNGATFVLGHGWIASPQPMTPLQPTGNMAIPGGAYAYAGGRN